jgi:hypothetical protein
MCEELRRLLFSKGYSELMVGKTAGSRVTFYNAELDDMIKFHRPHPDPIMGKVYLREIAGQLKSRGVI